MDTKLYAIIITKTGEILDAKTFKEYWKNYGSNSLYGWRKPKKIYLTLGQAKSGFAHVPKEMSEHLSIAEFGYVKEILAGSEVLEIQEKSRIKKREETNKRIAKYKLEAAEKELKRARENIQRY